jgi:hypothetical protein
MSKYLKHVTEKSKQIEWAIVENAHDYGKIKGAFNLARSRGSGRVEGILDGMLMPDGKFLLFKAFRASLDIGGHAATSEYLIGDVFDGGKHSHCTEMLGDGFIRFAHPHEPSLEFHAPLTAEQAAFIETLGFETEVHVECSKDGNRVSNVFPPSDNGVEIANAVKAFFRGDTTSVGGAVEL